MADNDITALVGSRICHDLISPLGAIGNGLELLQMSGGPDAPEVSLISDSLDSATARIRFFRVAFGDARPGQQIARTEVESALRHGFSTARLSLEFEARDMERQVARLLFLALQCLETAMPYGGTVRVSLGEARLSLLGSASRFAMEEALWSSLTDADSDYQLRPAQVQFALLRAHTEAEGRRLSVASGSDALSISLDL